MSDSGPYDFARERFEAALHSPPLSRTEARYGIDAPTRQEAADDARED